MKPDRQACAAAAGANPWRSAAVPDITFDDIVGMDEIKAQIRAQVIDPIRQPGPCDKNGTGLLLYGLSGTGKTTLARAIAHEMDAPLYTVQPYEWFSGRTDEPEEWVRGLFDAARSHPVSLIFFDDFDDLGRVQHGNQVLCELIDQMEGLRKSEDTVVLLAATSKPWVIDTVLLKRWFGHHFCVPLPGHGARIALLKTMLDGAPVDPALDLDRISSLTRGYNRADIAAVVNSAKLAALERAVTLRRAGHEDALSPVTQQDLEQAAAGRKSSIVKSDIDHLRQFAKEWGITLPDEL